MWPCRDQGEWPTPRTAIISTLPSEAQENVTENPTSPACDYYQLIHTSCVTTVSKQARQLTPSPSTCCVRSAPSRRHCQLTAREGAPCPAETHPWQVKAEVSAVTLETCFSHHFTAGSSSSLGQNRCCSQQLKWLPGSNLKPHGYTWLRQRKKHAGLHLAGEHIPPRGAPAGG